MMLDLALLGDLVAGLVGMACPLLLSPGFLAGRGFGGGGAVRGSLLRSARTASLAAG